MTMLLPEDTRPDYAGPRTEYVVEIDGETQTVTNADVAERIARNGGDVGPARTGWDV